MQIIAERRQRRGIQSLGGLVLDNQYFVHDHVRAIPADLNTLEENRDGHLAPNAITARLEDALESCCIDLFAKSKAKSVVDVVKCAHDRVYESVYVLRWRV